MLSKRRRPRPPLQPALAAPAEGESPPPPPPSLPGGTLSSSQRRLFVCMRNSRGRCVAGARPRDELSSSALHADEDNSPGWDDRDWWIKRTPSRKKFTVTKTCQSFTLLWPLRPNTAKAHNIKRSLNPLILKYRYFQLAFNPKALKLKLSKRLKRMNVAMESSH